MNIIERQNHKYVTHPFFYFKFRTSLENSIHFLTLKTYNNKNRRFYTISPQATQASDCHLPNIDWTQISPHPLSFKNRTFFWFFLVWLPRFSRPSTPRVSSVLSTTVFFFFFFFHGFYSCSRTHRFYFYFTFFLLVISIDLNIYFLFCKSEKGFKFDFSISMFDFGKCKRYLKVSEGKK